MKIAFLAASTPDALNAQQKLIEVYGQWETESADVIVPLGGDGFMLETLHQDIAQTTPIYGMNLGSIGFLLNQFQIPDLIKRIEKAQKMHLHPLHMKATTGDGSVHSSFAINEVSIYRQTRQAAKLSLTIDGVSRMPELICDGVLVATSAGSTAYNLSAHGPIIPLGSEIVALTPISAFRPRRWRGALLPSKARISVNVQEAAKRPVSAVADFTEIRDVVSIDIWESKKIAFDVLFDPEHNLEERILNEQFF